MRKNFPIAIDPSDINKSRKATPGLGYFWSDCAGKAKWGLEIAGLAAIDIDNHTEFHLDAEQIITDSNDESTLVEWYADVITSKLESLKEISSILFTDAWFSTRQFSKKMLNIK